MNRSVICLAAVCAVSLLGCGGGKYEPRCQSICSSASGCAASDQTKCLDDCRARTDALSQPCATCVFDNSKPMSRCATSSSGGTLGPGPDGTTPDAGSSSACCQQPTWAPVSSASCIDFCKNG